MTKIRVKVKRADMEKALKGIFKKYLSNAMSFYHLGYPYKYRELLDELNDFALDLDPEQVEMSGELKGGSVIADKEAFDVKITTHFVTGEKVICIGNEVFPFEKPIIFKTLVNGRIGYERLDDESKRLREALERIVTDYGTPYSVRVASEALSPSNPTPEKELEVRCEKHQYLMPRGGLLGECPEDCKEEKKPVRCKHGVLKVDHCYSCDTEQKKPRKCRIIKCLKNLKVEDLGVFILEEIE